MEAREKYILNEVISGMKLQFCIPVFQRNYTWNEKNCERLFDDIEALTTNKSKTHFIGSFVYKFIKFEETQYNQYILIDGQQRLTSLTLILKALHDYLKVLGEEYTDQMNEIKECYLFNKFAKDEKLRLKLKPNKEDDINYIYLMNDDLENIDKESLIYVNYHYFYGRISSMDCSVSDFYNALQRIEGVAVVLDEKDNPQLIFESLNSTGQDLEDVDLIRNYLFMNCPTNEQDRLYNDYWIKLESKLGNDFTDFIRDYLSLMNGTVTSNSKNKVYSAFRKYYIKEVRDLERFLSELIEYADAYKLLIDKHDISNIHDENYELNKSLNDNIDLNMRTTYPFLLGIMHDYNLNKIPKTDIVKILKLVETYVVRRSICNVQGGALSMAMASIYSELYKKYGEMFFEEAYKKVASKIVSINTNAYLPTDQKFEEEFTRRDMYNSKLRRYVLDRLELSGQSKEIVNLDTLTIEHIMPHTLNKAWEKYLNMKDVKEFHEQYKNRIGNLTLTAYNSEMKQKLFNEKKNHVDFSRLYLNKYFENITDWNKKEIDERGEKLFDIAKNIWPYPDVIPEESLISDSYDILSTDDAFDLTGTKPIKYVIDGEEKECSSWIDLYVNVLKTLYRENTDKFLNIINTETFDSVSGKMFSTNKEDLRTPTSLTETIYCESNINTMRKISVIRKIYEKLELDESLIVFISNSNSQF